MSISKQELQDIWRERVRATRLNYEAASNAFNATWSEHFEERLSSDPTLALQRTRKAESEALAEYMRVLQVYVDLVLHGKIPDEPNESNAG